MQRGSNASDAFRILYLARSTDEVARRYLDRLRRLRDEGFEISVLAGGGGRVDEIREQGIEVRQIPVRYGSNLAGLAGAYFIVQAHMIENPPVLVHAFGHRLAWIGVLAAQQVEVPVVLTTLEYHWLDEDPLQLPLGFVAPMRMPPAVERVEAGINTVVGPAYRKWMQRAYRWLGEHVDRYLVTTEFDFQLAQDLELAPVNKLEIAVGSPGVDLETYSLPEQGDPLRERARHKLGLPDHWRQVVGWVGPVTRRHGVDDLVKTVEELSRIHPSTGWLIMARGEAAGGHMRRLDRLVRRGQAYIVDSGVRDVLAYRAMDVFAWMGRALTPHDPIVEAAALAVPTIGYDTPAARSMVDDGQTGHLVYTGQREKLLGVLAQLLANPAQLRDMGWRARARSHLKFSRRDVDGQMLRLYDRLLDRQLS